MLHLTLVARASIGKLHIKTTYLVMQRILEMGEMCSAAFSCVSQQVGLEVLLLRALLLQVASVALLLCSKAACHVPACACYTSPVRKLPFLL